MMTIYRPVFTRDIPNTFFAMAECKEDAMKKINNFLHTLEDKNTYFTCDEHLVDVEEYPVEKGILVL